MKISIVSIGFISLGFVNLTTEQNEIEKMDKIMSSDHFVVSIERLDLGFFHNMQSYIFEGSDSKLIVTYKHTVQDCQDTTLDNTVLKSGIRDSLNSYLKAIKSFEIEHPIKFRRKFNKGGVWEIISIQNDKDTVKVYDVNHEAMTEIHRMIKNSVK